jgi:hypothetical protein
MRMRETCKKTLIPTAIALSALTGCVGGGVFYKETLTDKFALWAVDSLSWNDTFDIYPMVDAAAPSRGFDGVQACRLEFEVVVRWILREAAAAPRS